MIKSYCKNGKKLYEVVVHLRDCRKKQHFRKKRGVTSERKAKELEFQLRNELYQRFGGGRIYWTWGDWHEECLQRMKLSFKISTIKSYDGGLRKWLPREFVELPLEKVKPQNIHNLIFNHIGDRVSPYSQKHILKMINRILQMALEDGIIVRNPALGIRIRAPQTQQEVLNSKEAHFLLEEAFKCNHRFYKVWVFALMTGMRSGEMFALRWQDVDLESGFISVNKQWTNKDGIAPPKNRENRTIPINGDLRGFLQECKARKESYSQELWDSRLKKQVMIKDFLLPRMKEWEHGEQAQVLREFCRAIDITSIRFHDLRATFITNMLSQGAPLVQVMAVVGHRRMSTTDEYLRLAGINVQGVTERISYGLPQQDVGENVVSLASRHTQKPS